MEEIALFTDGSFDPKTHFGYGAYLLILEPPSIMDNLEADIQLKRFEDTTSSKLELQTLIWALGEMPPTHKTIIIYTDAQNIINLPQRRARLEAQDFRNKKGESIRNHQFYRTFFQITDTLNYKFVKVNGHQPVGNKNAVDHLFSMVDRASRKALREWSSMK